MKRIKQSEMKRDEANGMKRNDSERLSSTAKDGED